MSRRAVFRADASPGLGTGHVSRCLALADRLAASGWTCVFSTGPETLETVPALARSPYAVVSPDDPATAADLAVIDHYGLDAGFERACRAWAGRILVIDDLADRPHDCDVLVDQTAGRVAADYLPRVPADCQLLLGPEFALLRPEFARQRPAALARRHQGQVERILVSIGGSDPRDITSTTLHALRLSGLSCPVDVVVGSRSPNLARVTDLVETFDGAATLHVDTTHMAELMRDADLAVGACGVTSWERCVLGLPTLAVVIADNQRMIAHELAARHAIVAAGDWTEFSETTLAAELRRLAAAPDVLGDIAAAAAAVCDGLGVNRVIAMVDPS